MKSFCWRPQFARKKILFSGEDLQSNSDMSIQAKIRKKKLEKISLPNYSQKDPKTFRTSMHMEVVEDNDEAAAHDAEPSENASTIVIQTTPKSPEGPGTTKAVNAAQQPDAAPKPAGECWANKGSIMAARKARERSGPHAPQTTTRAMCALLFDTGPLRKSNAYRFPEYTPFNNG
ncbi:uncharacterized protein LOC144151339 [Haemaphysalis longicornis]